MQFYIEITTNVAMAGINSFIQTYLNDNPTSIVIFNQTIHDGVNFVNTLIVKR